MQTRAISARQSLLDIDIVRVEPGARRLARSRRTGGLTLRIALFACAVIVVGGIGIDIVMPSADASVAMAPVAHADASLSAPWIEINHPLPLFEVAGAAMGHLPLTYRARRRDGIDERQDFLTFGQFGEDTPFLALSILRRAVPAKPADFFVDLARLGAEQLLSVSRSALPTLLPTRFGDFAIADVTLARGTRPTACLGFRLQNGDAPTSPVAITGFACGTPDHAMDRALLGCVIDRVDLLSAGDDDALREVFVAAERRRGQPCAPSRLMAAGSRGQWLDGEAASPSLRPERAGKPRPPKR